MLRFGKGIKRLALGSPGGRFLTHREGRHEKASSQHSMGVFPKVPFMLALRKLTAVFVLSLCSALAACKADSVQPSPVGPCNADAARGLVGQARPTDAEAMRVTNAKSVRQIEPGQMVTQDFREDRVTVETDPSSGRVVAARCG